MYIYFLFSHLFDVDLIKYFIFGKDTKSNTENKIAIN